MSVNLIARSLNNLDDFQNFVIENKILDSQDFRRRFSTIYKKLQKLKISKLILYYGKESTMHEYIHELDDYETVDDFQSLINQKGFKKVGDLRSYNFRLYRKMLRLGINTKVIFPEYFNNWVLSNFQEFINKNNIQDPTDFITRYPKVYTAANRKKLCSKLKYPKRQNYSWYNNLQDALDAVVNKCNEFGYIFLNKDTWKYEGTLKTNIILKCEKHNHIWNTSFNSFVQENHRCIFCSKEISKAEIEIKNLLEELNINFEFRARFSFLEKKHVDFYIPELDMVIECQGEQHFVAIEKFGGEDRLIKQKERDLEKYRILKEQGKEIIYFVDPTLIRSEYRNEILNEHIPNYFEKVYTDLNKIGLIIASKINY